VTLKVQEGDGEFNESQGSKKEGSDFWRSKAGFIGRARLRAAEENGVARQPVAPSAEAANAWADSRHSAIVQCEPAGFASIINVSVNAVESWEQGVRRPREATLKLLAVAERHPEVLLASE
jgi:transcriptional regulator with XRE-family HTH domain